MTDIARVLGTEEEQIAAAIASPTEVKAAMALWLAGASYADVAAQMHYRSAHLARLILERALADTVDDTQDRSIQRRKMSLQLDTFLRAIVVKALDANSPEQLSNMRMALQLLERKARLLGLDAPIQAIIANPTGDELDRWLMEVANVKGLAIPEEGDPFLVVQEN